MSHENKVNLSWDENFYLVIEHGIHKVVIDRPPGEEGLEEHVGPIDLFVTGLGACIMHVAASFLHRRDIHIGDLGAEITWEYEENPYRIGHISVELKLPEDLDKKVCTALEKVVKACTAHNTLTHPPHVETSVEACRPKSE